MEREIRFRFWTPDKRMIDDHDGWVADIGINEAIQASIGYGYILMQFTGLKDKNGKEIYEGDILLVFENDWDEDEKKNSYEVAWGGDYPAFILKGYEDIEYNSLQHACTGVACEVIGNIHANPELIPTKP